MKRKKGTKLTTGFLHIRFFVSVLAVVMVFALLLTGCVTTDPTPTDTTPTDTTPTDTTPTDTTPTDPTPTDPTPTDSTPTDPTPTQPPRVLVGIRLESLPKTEYLPGESLDTNGGVLLCEYSDGTVARINLTSSAVSGFENVKAPGTYTLTVRYTDNGMLAQTTYTITVLEAPTPPRVLVGIRLETPPKTHYKLGEYLDTNGGVLLCEYSDGTFSRIALTRDLVSGFEQVRGPGMYTLTVRYKENGMIVTTTYDIIVTE